MKQITIDLSDTSKICEAFGFRPMSLPTETGELFNFSKVDPDIRRKIKEILIDSGFETDSV